MTTPKRVSNDSYLRTRTGNSSPANSVSRVALLFPGIAVSVVAVAFPEAQAIFVQQHEAARPLHALPRIKMRNNEATWTTMFRGERHAVVIEGKEHVWAE